jgi:energy-coupling factor transporter ATP-binding protein EcfA2
MDSFIKIIPQKKEEKKALKTIHGKQIELVRTFLKENKNVFICGPSGSGKTYILEAAMEGFNHVELKSEHLHSKSLFLPFIKPSTKHVFIEDYESVFNPIVNRVSDGNRITRGSLVVTSTNMCMFPNFETVFIPRHKPDVLLSLTDKSDDEAYAAAYRSQGNIRNFFSYLDGYDMMDDFKTPKEFIAEVLSSDGPLEILDSVSEHGHIWDIFQENYPDSAGVDLVRVSESFSIADFYDNHIYRSGDWNLMPYFVLHALTIPKSHLGNPLNKDKIRPGSCWTKQGNRNMRKQKCSDIRIKSRMGLGIEEMCLLKNYAEKGDISKLLDYNITPQDFDVINHLAVGNGLKQKDVTRVKKALKNAYERGRD